MTDDDFWTTYISATPEEDRDFAPKSPQGCGWLLAILVLLAMIVVYILA